MKTVIVVLCLMFLIWPVSVQSQNEDHCPVIVEQALLSTEEFCSGTQRNQICYGNRLIEFNPLEEVIEQGFSEPGDTVELLSVGSMWLSPMNVTEAVWGVALMRAQASLPDTLPGENVMFILFGDVELLTPPEGESRSVQAFYFRTGIGDAVCVEAPESGILIQTPKGRQQVALSINGMSMVIGSTVYIQAADELAVSVLDGEISVAAFGVQRTIPAGARVTLPLDENFLVSGPPDEPKPYRLDSLHALPLEILPETHDIAEPLPVEQLAELTPQDAIYIPQCGGDQTVTVPGGGVYYIGASDEVRFAADADAYSFSVTVNGEAIVPVRSYVVNVGNIFNSRREFYAGPLPEGTYTIHHDQSLSREIDQGRDGLFGPANWTIDCTLIVGGEGD